MGNLRKLTIGDFFDQELVILTGAMLASIGVQLRKVKIKSRQFEDDCLSEFLKLQRNVEELDISQCNGIDGSLFGAFKINGQALKRVIVSFDDHRMNLLKTAMREAGIGGCRIVKII